MMPDTSNGQRARVDRRRQRTRQWNLTGTSAYLSRATAPRADRHFPMISAPMLLPEIHRTIGMRPCACISPLLVLTLTVSAPAHSQDTTRTQPSVVPAVTPPPSLPRLVMPAAAGDTIEVLVTARALDTVRVEKDRLLSARRDAESRWTSLRDQSQQLKAGVGEIRSTLNEATNREKQAKKEKRDADRLTAQVEKRQLERSLRIVDARYELRQAQVEHARIERDFLDASIRADDAEMSIAERRDQVVPNDPSQRAAFLELTNRWLQALRTRTARAYDLEDRRFKVVEAQLELLKQQRGN